jgi:alanine racemase
MREIRVDLDAVVANYREIRSRTSAKVCAVVKANAYGHGMHEVAKALDDAGADALGVADLNEALELRAAGIKTRIICWLLSPKDDFELANQSDIELGVSNFEVLAALSPGSKIHIKVDTGLGRNGFARDQWPRLFERLAGQEIYGLFSHLANTSEAEDLKQQELFEEALAMAEGHSITILDRHLAATGGTLSYPHMHYDMVRCGIGIYGLTPFDDKGVDWLTPAMQVTAEIANVKRVPKGQGVSYGYHYITDRETTLVLVPFGYGEGMPRVSESAEVSISGKRFKVSGRIAMDQFLVDVGDLEVAIGDEVIIFGQGGPAVEELAMAAGTINYEIVTRIGGRAQRVYRSR